MKKLIIFICAIMLSYTSTVLAKTSSGRITMTINLSDHGDKEIAQIWIPYPVSDIHQTITNIKIDGAMSSSGVYTVKEFSVKGSSLESF